MHRPLRAVACASCGAKVREDRVRCLRCGQLLHTAPEPRSSPAARRGALVAAAVSVTVGIVGIWIGTSRPGTKTTPATGAPPAATTVPTLTADAAIRPLPITPGFLDGDRAGRAALRRGEFDAAVDAFAEAARARPDNPEASNDLGQALVRTGRVKEALPRFDRAIELAPATWSYRFNRARAYGLLEQWPRAVEDYSGALALFPGDYVTEFNLGLALDKAGLTSDGLDHLRRAAAGQPQDASLQLAVAVVADRAHLTGDAVAAYGRFLDLNPGEPEASRAKSRLSALTRATADTAIPSVPPNEAAPQARP